MSNGKNIKTKNVMKKIKLNIIAISGLLFAFSESLSAQDVWGYVRSGPEGKGLGNITVYVKENPSINTITDSGGRYTLTGLAYDVRVTLVANSIERILFVHPGVNHMNFLFDAVRDRDGNSYNAIEIYDQTRDENLKQVWLDKNLKVTHFRDGTVIPNYTSDSDWANLRDPGYCAYQNESINLETYGALYNWYTVNTGNLCPTGWHVPSDAEMERFTSHLGGLGVAGAKMKEMGTLHWESPNTGATNESNFTALPGSSRSHVGYFHTTLHTSAAFWTSTETSEGGSMAYWYLLQVNQDAMERRGDGSYESKEAGFSVRCLKDTLTTQPVSEITPNSAQSGGDLLINMGPDVTVKGICWSTTSMPTTSDNHTETITFPPGDKGLGKFNATLTGLVSNTTYFVRAYATDALGNTMYGNEISFKTYQTDAVKDYDGNYYDKVKIGSQIWLAENLKVTHFNNATNIPYYTDPATWNNLDSPGYCWYDNDASAYKDVYGALYNWYTVGTGNLCPVGWHVPSDADWTTLTTYLGGESVAGGKLKETGTIHWRSPNTGATNERDFTSLPGGFRAYDGVFGNIGLAGYWWSASENGNTEAFSRSMAYDISFVSRNWGLKTGGLSVRCIQDEIVTLKEIVTSNSAQCGGNIINEAGLSITSSGVCWSTSSNPTVSDDHTSDGTLSGTFMSNLTDLTPDTRYYVRAYFTDGAVTVYGSNISFKTYKSGSVSDNDGNYYNVIPIGVQLWMAENLKTTRLNDGTSIRMETEASNWINLTEPGYCWYENDIIANKNVYGALYNFYSVNTGKLCPSGWRVPSDDDWTVLTDFLGGEDVAGGKLKEKGTEHWEPPNIGAEDEFGFTARPGGYRIYNGIFNAIGLVANWWTSTRDTYSLMRSISYNSSDVGTGGYQSMETGFSVRCVKDTNNIVVNRIDDDENPGSLRSAIIEANLTPVLDKITFSILGKGPFVIQLKSALPTITNYRVIIDGLTQPGSSASTSTILVELDGTNAGSGSNGLTINASNCTVKGLVINKFSGNGIQITNATGNIISANSIYNNGGLGIDLGNDGAVTENDDDDTDVGANNLQNYPVLDKTVISLGEIYIDGHLKSMPDKSYTLEFFASKLADNTGYGEGQTYLGSAIVTTDADGNASFTDQKFPYQTIYGDVITATATDPDRNTSEFSKALGGLPDQHLGNNSLDYYVNPSGIPNIADENKIVNAVNAAFATWTGIPTANFTFNYVNTTDEQYAHIDGLNLISFSDDEYLFGDWVLAITAKTLKLGPTDAETQILDADIIFNPAFVKHQLWNFGIADYIDCAGYFDIQSVTTHEIGHILGLLHTGVHNATMWFEMPQGIDARTLEQDDKSWASYKYPEPGYNIGSISGHITYGYDDALTEPVAGALVLAINTASRDTIHAYSDADGNYLVPGLNAGSYNVYIEPLDGDVRGRPLSPRNISLYIYCNTTNFDYPGEFYSGENETAEESGDNVTSVVVNTGAGITGIDFITNKDITNPTVVSVTPPDLSKSQDIGIRFSEPMDMATLIKANCYLIKSGDTSPIGGSYTDLENETNGILFYPEEVLDYNTSYTLYITVGVADLKGLHLLEPYTYSFPTGAGDANPPAIVGIIPADKATGVLVDEKIVVSFSESMDKQTVLNSFTISPDIEHTNSWDNVNKILTINPSLNYTEGETYNITVSTGAEDISGNAMENSVSSSFTVVPAAPPTIEYLEPGQTMTSGITAKTPVVADFSEPINTSTVDETTFKLLKGDSGGTPVTGAFEFLDGDRRVVFRPAADLDFDQIYTVILSPDIWDVSTTPQKLQNEISVSFTTADQPLVPEIKFIDPPSEHVGAQVTIGGQGFDPDPTKNTVTFYNGVAAPVISATLTSLTVAVPVGAESGLVNVKVNGVTVDANSPYDFLVIQPYSDPCNEARGSATTGGDSRDVATDFNATKAYVTNSGSNSVSVVDLESLETVNTIDVGEYPLMIDIDPEGKRAYVTNHGSRTVSVIDLMTETEIKKINVGTNPYGVAVSPDGEHVFVANYTSKDISVIDVDPTSGGFDHVTSNIVTGTENRKLAIDPNSSMIVVTGNDGLKIIELIKTEFGFDYSTTNASAGTPTRDTKIITEAGLAVVSTMDGRLLFIGITKGIDTFGAVVKNSNPGANAGQVQPDFSGVFLYVSNPYDNQVTVYKMTYGGSGSDIGSYNGFSIEEYWTIPTGISPQGMVISRLNNELLVVNEFSEMGSANGSLTAVKICCREKSSSDDIVALALYVQGLINSGDISATDGKMLIKKLNDAVSEITWGKTKTAINHLNTFINKVSSLKKTGKITQDQAQILIDYANAIIAKLNAGKSDISDAIVTGIEDSNLDSINETKLGVIYPNPTREGITVDYEIADDMKAGKVSIKVYDVLGRVIGNLVNETLEPGRYSTSWNGRHENGTPVSRGIYYIRFSAGKTNEVKQIMLVR